MLRKLCSNVAEKVKLTINYFKNKKIDFLIKTNIGES
jgi:hypothetical protein